MTAREESGASSARLAASPVGHAAVTATGISHSFAGLKVLDDVSIAADRGDCVALVGRSGAGKTTLLRILAGLARPERGEVTVDGRPLAALRPGRELTSLVGMVQQRLDLIPQLSVRHNVEAGLLGQWSLWRALAGLFLPWSNAASLAAIGRVGLGGRESERVSRLSGGEQQRVAIARVLAQDPQVILADEPVASLDPRLADDMLGLLREIARERNHTVIASLHIPDLARRHFDRVIGLRDGRIAFDVAPDDLSDDLLASLYAPGQGDRPQEITGSDGRGPWGV